LNLFAPALALGAVLSTGYATLFHLWRRGSHTALQLDVLAAWLGFAGGHFLGGIAGIHWLRVGQLDVLSGTAGAVVALLIAESLER